MQDAYRHCESLVRERDREAFLASLFAPEPQRRGLHALYAFALEIERVPDAVREPFAGEIRLQWWRDVLAGMRDDEAKANPVAAALLDTIARTGIDAERLQQAIDARQFDLAAQPMESQQELLRYLDDTSGVIVALAAQLLEPGWNTEEAAKLAGRAIGMLRLLRSLPKDIANGRLFIPLDLLAANGVHTESVMAGENSEGFQRTLSALAESAERDAATLRSLRVPTGALPAFLRVALVPASAARVRKTTDPFRMPLELSSLRSQFVIWRAARTGRL